MAIDNIAIRQRIHHFRKKKGLSQMALAERVDISPTYMSYLETGIRSMGVETLVRLANALNVSADELLIDCLSNSIKASNHEFATLISDCSEYEMHILLDVASSTKRSLRENAFYNRRGAR